ncbi:MAG: hypothetical protein HY675_16720 [Chloroflexi bacterium]|nr:hypothetical protein [Chloroflexota bacterium]
MFFNVVRREDGVIELHPQVTVDASKAWFWSDRWQTMEREGQNSYDRGDFQRHESGKALLPIWTGWPESRKPSARAR